MLGDGGFELVVPRDPLASDFERSLESTLDAVASFYGMPFSSLEALMLPASEVVSLRLEGEQYHGGAAPFSQFERMLEHFKRTITRTAAFVLTDDPAAQATPKAARRYLDDCWFMQTARGSFISRVALPIAGTFGPELSLFTRPIKREAVADTIQQVSLLVGSRVLERDETLFTEDGFGAVRSIASVGVLEEVSRLLRGTEARRVSFEFNRKGTQRDVVLPPLTAARLQNLDHFINYVREQVRATFTLSVSGRVFEVRRSRRTSSSSIVGVLADVDNRQQLVTFKVGARDLGVFLDRFASRAPITVQGRARRLRTQIRIEADLSYDASESTNVEPEGH